ncbi:ribosome-binding factor A [Candidatus Nomurabacteria bacterium]|nr:ribosome-binding factor A [Candidatus Nomurabacteria bacterium]
MKHIDTEQTGRLGKVANLVKEIGAEFLVRENNKTSLITVTACSVSPDLKRAILFITVLPEKKEEEVLSFVQRKRSELRETLKKRMTTKNVPFLDIMIDQGEKNRQKIDELLHSK